MSMSFDLRVGLLRLCKLTRVEIQKSDDDEPQLHAAVSWIESQLSADEKHRTQEERSKEWSAAGMCSRCGDDDSQCICYAR